MKITIKAVNKETGDESPEGTLEEWFISVLMAKEYPKNVKWVFLVDGKELSTDL